MGNKVSSYRKLELKFKHRESELISDIIQLAEHSDEYSGQLVKAKWQILLDQEKILRFGEKVIN